MATVLKEHVHGTIPGPGGDTPLRGDVMDGKRYTSAEFAEREWQQMWTRVWHIGGFDYQIPEPGDYITSDMGRENILLVRQKDGGIKAFYNVCQHRGARLVFNDMGSVGEGDIVCPYHGWKWDIGGALNWAQDAEDFPDGDPCDSLRLEEIPCDVEFGMIWYNMDPKCGSLHDYLGPIVEEFEPYHMENMVRVLNMTARTDCNWKVIEDNFNEGYHVTALHPQIADYIEAYYKNCQFDIYEEGHNRGWFPSGTPAAFIDLDTPSEALSFMMGQWDLDPADFTGPGKAQDVRVAIQQQKRKLGPERGYTHYDDLADYQLTDYLIYNLFPNYSITVGPDGVQLLRPRPHPTDPEKCLFDHWYFVPKIEGIDAVPSPAGGPDLPLEDAPMELVNSGEETLGTVCDQDLSIATSQQLGLRSRSYTDSCLAHQERRVRRFHEVLNDYLEGRR